MECTIFDPSSCYLILFLPVASGLQCFLDTLACLSNYVFCSYAVFVADLPDGAWRRSQRSGLGVQANLVYRPGLVIVSSN